MARIVLCMISDKSDGGEKSRVLTSEQAQPLSSDKTFENDVLETQLKLDQSQCGSRGSVLDSGQDYSRLRLYLHNLQASDECQLFSAKGCFGEYWL